MPRKRNSSLKRNQNNKKLRLPTVDHTKQLPDELLLMVFEILDFSSVRRCMRVSKRFKRICMSGILYRDINLSGFTTWFSSDLMLISIESCINALSSLDLSMSNTYTRKRTRLYYTENNCKISTTAFNKFIINCGTNLKHLILNDCIFVHASSLNSISMACKLHLKELNLNGCWDIDFYSVTEPLNFPEMEFISFSRTNIDMPKLQPCLISMPKLKHIKLDYCYEIDYMDEVPKVLAVSNTQLEAVSFSHTNISDKGLQFLTAPEEMKSINLFFCDCPLEIRRMGGMIKQYPKIKGLLTKCYLKATSDLP